MIQDRENMIQDRKLIEEYRRAWNDFDSSARRFQSASADSGDLEALLLDVEGARLRYAAARDRLVARMLELEIAPRTDESRIRGSARLLWELTGKPNNSAEKDWLRAEALAQGACS